VDFDDPDPFVPVWEGPFNDAQAMLRRVEEAQIPVDLDDALLVGQARVVVPRSYAEDARAAIAGDTAPWPGLTPEGPSLRRTVLLVLVAIVVVALIAGLIL
jgi:hypothetical protein